MLVMGIFDDAPIMLAQNSLLTSGYGVIKAVLLFVVWVSGLIKIAKFFIGMGAAEASQGAGKSSGLMKMAMLAATLVVATWFIGGSGIGTMQSLLDRVTGTIEKEVAESDESSILGDCADAKTIELLQKCLGEDGGGSPPATTSTGPTTT